MGIYMNKRVVKMSVGPHFGVVKNPKTFDEAYDYIISKPYVQYTSLGNCSPFKCKAYYASKGRHKGEKVIKFYKPTSNMTCGYAYSDCWGKKTNCYGSYIDCYTQVI
jgi:hypothetical protein